MCIRIAIYALCYSGTEQHYKSSTRLIAECLVGRANIRGSERSFKEQERDGRNAVAIDRSYVEGYVAVAAALDDSFK